MSLSHANYLKTIAQKVLDNTASVGEIEFLQQYYDVFDQLLDDENPLSDAEKTALEATMLSALHRRIDIQAHSKKIRRMHIRNWIPYVAAVAVMALGIVVFYQKSIRTKYPVPQGASIPQGITPGGNKAILKLGDGRLIELSSDKSGIITGESLSYNDGSPLGNAPGATGKGNAIPIQYTLVTPRGGQYQLVLPDGSKVWLNAASTLKYPSKFTGGQRIVELEGEAYFEIKRQQKTPFLVKTQNQTVEVLGTQFNITAYADEQDTKTTLAKGSVNVVNLKSKAVTKLSPGEQSIVRHQETTVATVDVVAATAWKEGYFVLDDTKIQHIMRQAARWYDVDIEYRGNVTTQDFNGIVSRYDELAKLLEVLQTTEAVHFKMEGRRVIVMP